MLDSGRGEERCDQDTEVSGGQLRDRVAKWEGSEGGGGLVACLKV